MASRDLRALVLAGLVAFLAWPAAAWGGSGVDITATEGASFTKRVADIESCLFSSATIDWGDGTLASSGQFEAGTPPGVKGTHTYAEEGVFHGTVDYTTDCPENTASFTATVGDAALNASGRDVSTAAGQSLTAVVSHFTDADPQGAPADFSADISWGDGTSSAGTVSVAPGGGFDVTGTHTYQHAGFASVNVTITDAGGSSAQSSAVAQIVGLAPTASFTYAPSLPCRDAPVTFDATSSGPAPIARYDWSSLSAVFSGPDPGGIVTGSFPMSGFNYLGPGGHPAGRQPVRALRAPAEVSLTVTGGDGASASTQQTVTFTNASELGTAVWGGVLVFTPTTHTIWFLWDYKPDHPGACTSLGGAVGATAAGVIAPGARVGADSLSAPVSCPRRVTCHGRLGAVPAARPTSRSASAAARSRRRVRAVRPFGVARVSVRVGRVRTIRIPLNKRGRRLARRHRLKRVTLVLFDTKGGAQSRTVKPRSR